MKNMLFGRTLMDYSNTSILKLILTVLSLFAFVLVLYNSYYTISDIPVVLPESIEVIQPDKLPVDPVKRIILSTYGRSGSTYTSELLSHKESVFYVFEPLYAVYLQDGMIGPRLKETSKQKGINLLNKFFSCDFIHLSENFTMHLASSSSTKKMGDCLRRIDTGTRHLKCLQNVYDHCKSSETVLIKTIRLPLNWTIEMLEEDKEIRIVFLVRDPRATVQSQHTKLNHYKFLWSKNKTEMMHNHCLSLEKDLNALKLLKTKYPDRVLALRYEDIVLNQLTFSNQLYSFAGLSFTRTDKKFIFEISNSNKNGGTFSTHRSDSIQAMNEWRNIIDYNVVETIDKLCGHLYTDLGYIEIKPRFILKDLKVPVHKSPNYNLFLR